MPFSDFVHPHAKAPWIHYVIAAFDWGCQHSMMINSYQAEGGFCVKTFCLAFVLNIVNLFCLFSVLLSPVSFCFWLFALYHAHCVYKASTPC